MKSLMIDMDEVLVDGRFTEFLNEFLEDVDFTKLHGYDRQSLIDGREEEFKRIYKYKNLYKYDDDTYVLPKYYSVEVIEELNKHYEVYIVTSYVWKKDIFCPAINLLNKYDYLHHFFPFINSNNIIFISDKSKLQFDIGIDDRVNNLKSCKKKILFTEFRNKSITSSELKKMNVVRADTWLDIKDILLNE